MKALAYVPIKLTLFLIIGILIGYYLPVPLMLAMALLVVSLLVLGYLFFKNAGTDIQYWTATGATVIALGIFASLYAQPLKHDSHFSKLAQRDAPVLHVKITAVLKPNTFSQNYLAEVLLIDDRKTLGKLLVNQTRDTTIHRYSVDDELIIQSKLEGIKGPRNPHQFGYKKYMLYLGVHHSVRLNSQNYIKLPQTSMTISGYAYRAREYIIAKLRQEAFGHEQLAIMQALLLGERSEITPETYANYIDAGAVHILAVSGLHVGILLLLIQFLLRPIKSLPQGRIWVFLTTIIFLWGFAFIAGFSPSIIRASTMFSFFAYAQYLNRPTNGLNVLALSLLFVLLVIDPKLIFQVGFQMSYAAVFAIIVLYPLLQKFWQPPNKVLRYFWQLLSVSVAAQLGVLPISLYYFHQFPSLFFISNILIVPFLAFILGIGILVIVLTLWDLVPGKLIWFYNEVLGIMNRIVAWIAQQESFVLRSISFDGVQLFLGFLIVCSLAYLLTQLNFKRSVLLLGSILLFQGYTFYQEYRSGQKREVLLLHQGRNSVILDRSGHNLRVLSNDSVPAKNLASNYAVEERVNRILYTPLQNSYNLNNEKLHIIDSTGVYTKTTSESIYLLTQSPKINLERFILENRPTKILVDGSNYPSYTKRWRQTCIKHKIPFHATYEKGFYTLLGN